MSIDATYICIYNEPGTAVQIQSTSISLDLAGDVTFWMWVYYPSDGVVVTPREVTELSMPDGSPLIRLASDGLIHVKHDDTSNDILADVNLDRLNGQWVFVAFVVNSTTNRAQVYRNDVLVADADISTWTRTGSATRWTCETVVGQSLKNIHFYDTVLTEVQLNALHAAGHAHDARDDFGAWTAADPGKYAWETPAVGTALLVVSNTGTGGAAGLNLSVVDFVSVGGPVDEVITQIPRVGSIGKFPPIRTFYRTSGAVGSYFRELGTTIPRIVFPVGGNLGAFTWRFWIRRPLTPVTTEGTIGQISAGDATITVGLDPTEHVVVTVDDGTINVTDTSGDPVSGYTWTAITVTGDPVNEEVMVYVDDTPILVLDYSTLTFPVDIETGLSFTYGSKVDGTDPLDVDIVVPIFYEETVDQDDIDSLWAWDWRDDPRNQDADTPPPVVLWIDPTVDGVIPGAIKYKSDQDLLVPVGDAESQTESCDVQAWLDTPDTIAVKSASWWDDDAAVPEMWTLEKAVPVSRPLPIITQVVRHTDGATLRLRLSFQLEGEAEYTISSPPDLTGCELVQVAFIGRGAVYVDGADQQANVYQELLPPGPIWETANDPKLEDFVEALAQEQARLYNQTNKITLEGNPATTVELIAEWEEVFGLPDDCAPPPLSLLSRQAAVAAAFLSHGGQTVGYYLSLLEQVFGVSGTIEENWPSMPFMTGTGQEGSGSAAGDPLGSLANGLTWRITMDMSEVQTQEQADRIECLFNRIKPSHTNVVFNYVGPGDVYPDVSVYYDRAATGELTATLPTIKWLGFWLNVHAAGEGEIAIKVGSRNITISIAAEGFLVDMAGSDFANVVGYALDTWHHFVVEYIEDVTVLYVNYFARQWDTTGSALTGTLTFFDGNEFPYSLKNIIGFNRNLTEGERSALRAAGHRHDARDAYSFSWLGELPVLEWIDADNAGVVGNVGSGGTADLTFSGDTTSEES